MNKIEKLLERNENFAVISARNSTFGYKDVFLLVTRKTYGKFYNILHRQDTYKQVVLVEMDDQDIKYFRKNIPTHFEIAQCGEWGTAYELKDKSFKKEVQGSVTEKVSAF